MMMMMMMMMIIIIIIIIVLQFVYICLLGPKLNHGTEALKCRVSSASNAFNALNRASALHNIRILCPVISVYAINTYSQPARLLITGGKELVSAEGTTQGDPKAMGMYTLSMQPLITALQYFSDAKQCWFADDASGIGTIIDIKKWWDALNEYGPELGYFPHAKKCWIIVKPPKEEWVREAFKDTPINVTTKGHKRLGATLRSRSYPSECNSEKVETWVSEVTKLRG